MRTVRFLFFIGLTLLTTLFCAFAGDDHDADLVLWFNQPAEQWDHGLPVGNGRLGGVLLGGVEQDRLYLNEESIWSHDGAYLDRPNAYKYIPEVRRLLFAGKYEEAEKLMMDKVMQERLPSGTNANQELGYLDFAWQGQEQVRHYRRALDIEDAVATVQYDAGKAAYTRTLFASAPDQVLVYRIESSLDSMLHGTITFGRAAMPEKIEVDGTTMQIAGLAGKKHGAQYNAMITIETEGGSARPLEHGWMIRDCKSVTVYVSARTDYNQSDPALVAEQDMVSATARDYGDMLADHVREYQDWFHRFSIDLGQTDARYFPADQRIEAIRLGSADPGLMALYVQFGRYLLISSSRPGDMPANLQGIWVQGITPPWNSDYHININIQMNYWPSEVTNLSECHMPFLHFIDLLRENGRATASELYDCSGFTAHHTTDAWHYTTSFGFPTYGAWPMGAGWISRHMWEHFEFTGDTLFLQDKGYPVMKEAAAFFMDFLVKDPETGLLVSGPSMSPENRFVTPSGGRAAMCMGPSMDHQIIYDNLTACIRAGQLLDRDSNLRKKWQKTLDQLTPPKIGPDGRIMEWSKNFVEAEPGHRHMSHLYGLHPGSQFTWQRTPQFMEAAQKVIEYRLSHGGGHTGWSRAWMINFYARLKDGEAAYRNVQALLQKSTLPNLWDTHPPFQIDGNFGATAGIVEMLLQSHAGEIELLPALPETWPSGRLAGARARGAFEVDISWSDGVLIRAEIKSLKGGVCRLSYRGHTLEKLMDSGSVLVVGAADFR